MTPPEPPPTDDDYPPMWALWVLVFLAEAVDWCARAARVFRRGLRRGRTTGAWVGLMLRRLGRLSTGV